MPLASRKFFGRPPFFGGVFGGEDQAVKLVLPNCPVDPTLGSTFDSTWIGAPQDAIVANKGLRWDSRS